MNFWILLQAWMRREWILRRRYAWDTAAEFLTGYAVFVLLALGVKVANVQKMGFSDAEGGLIVGFTILTLVMAAYRRLAYALVSEAAVGTFEQFAMCPAGALQLWTARAFSVFVSSTFFASTQLLLMMATTGRWLNIHIPSFLVLLTFIYASSQGVGLALAGLAIIEKQVQQIFQLGSWTFMGLSMLPLSALPGGKYLPVVWGTELARRVMIGKMNIADLRFADVAFLVVHGTCYFAVGLTIFVACERRARVAGTLGHY